MRWWDGAAWTERVADGGVPTIEVVIEVTAAQLTTEAVEQIEFEALPFDLRLGQAVRAYSDEVRFARALGQITLPVEHLREWEVVGESYRQDALLQAAGPKCEDGHWAECVATLRPEPENPHDDQAIAVDIDGRHVGYLPRDLARRHRAAVRRAIHTAGTATCAAVINGGWYRPEEESEGHFGVRLYFGERWATSTVSSLPAPANNEQRIAYQVEDEHDHITVTGEENFQDTIVAALGDDWIGDRPFRVVGLGPGADQKGRETVVVDIAGEPVGWLTPKMAGRFLAAAQTAQAEGRRLTACATLEQAKRKGCEDEIDVVLRVPRGWRAI